MALCGHRGEPLVDESDGDGMEDTGERVRELSREPGGGTLHTRQGGRVTHQDLARLQFQDQFDDALSVTFTASNGLHRGSEDPVGVTGRDTDTHFAGIDRQTYTAPQEDRSPGPGTVRGRSVPTKAQHRGWEINTVVLFIR